MWHPEDRSGQRTVAPDFVCPAQTLAKLIGCVRIGDDPVGCRFAAIGRNQLQDLCRRDQVTRNHGSHRSVVTPSRQSTGTNLGQTGQIVVPR